MRRLLPVVFVAGAIGVAPAQAADVSVLFQAFSPSAIDVLPGETVRWSNVSERAHTVTADDGSFDAELAGGDTFSVTAAATPGAHPYHCRIHAGMTGEFDVWRVIMGALPPAPVPPGQSVPVSGRTASAQTPVTIERDLGSGYHPIATALPAADGTWHAAVTAEATGDYRAVSGLDVSETRRLLVVNRRVEIRATARGIRVLVTPDLPYGPLLLERRTRERFGWYPVARTRLDYLSRADFAIARPATVRVSVVDKDGWTPLATSAPLHLRLRVRR